MCSKWGHEVYHYGKKARFGWNININKLIVLLGALNTEEVFGMN